MKAWSRVGPDIRLPPRPVRRPRRALTERETEVLVLIAQGMSDTAAVFAYESGLVRPAGAWLPAGGCGTP